MVAQASASYGIATTLLGRERVIRVNPTVPAKRFGLDKVSEMNSLKGLGETEAREWLPKLRPVLFDTPAEPFNPPSTD